MLLHVITNFTANAGAEAMLSRLLRGPGANLVVPLLDVSERYRASSGPSVRYRPLRANSGPRMLLAVRQLADIIATERPDAVLCWMYHAMVVGTLAGRLAGGRVPVFWNVRQSLDDVSVLSRSTKIALGASRLLSRCPDGIVYNSSRAAELHARFGFRNANVTVIPNGFDPVTADPPEPHQPSVFGIAARFHPQKDHRTFFEAAARLARRHPQARFVAAGAGLEPGNEAVRRLLAACGLEPERVSLLGELSDMASFYRAIDVLVLSSRTEGFPNVVGEAMNHGRPVVTTDVGDAAAIVGDTGLVVRPGDPGALAEAMEAMLRCSPQDYTARARAAQARIRHDYSLTSVARRFSDFVAPGVSEDAAPLGPKG